VENELTWGDDYSAEEVETLYDSLAVSLAAGDRIGWEERFAHLQGMTGADADDLWHELNGRARRLVDGEVGRT
jgi:hypothetical protein